MQIAIPYADGEIKEVSQKTGENLEIIFQDYTEQLHHLVFEDVWSFEKLNRYEDGLNGLDIKKGSFTYDGEVFNEYTFNDGSGGVLLKVLAKNLVLK